MGNSPLGSKESDMSEQLTLPLLLKLVVLVWSPY